MNKKVLGYIILSLIALAFITVLSITFASGLGVSIFIAFLITTCIMVGSLLLTGLIALAIHWTM